MKLNDTLFRTLPNGIETLSVYYEFDFISHIHQGNDLQASIQFISQLHNVVNFLYLKINEPSNNPSGAFLAGQIDLRISQIKIWDTPDPYPLNELTDRATLFQDLNPTFPGDIAHLIQVGAPYTSGIALIPVVDGCIPLGDTNDVLCINDANTNVGPYSISRFGFAELDLDISTGQPPYSYGTALVAHEIGHTLGGRHTFECHWFDDGSGNLFAIERACGVDPGTCDPTQNGCIGPNTLIGTNFQSSIMSYCWPNSAVDFNHPFNFNIANDILNNVCNLADGCAFDFDDCLDLDFDGICDCTDENDIDCDCDSTNPNIPNLPEAICSDGNPFTINDEIGSDGCTCIGELWNNDLPGCLGDEPCNNIIIGGTMCFEDRPVGHHNGSFYGGYDVNLGIPGFPLDPQWVISSFPSIANYDNNIDPLIVDCNQAIALRFWSINNLISYNDGFVIPLSNPIPCNAEFNLRFDFALFDDEPDRTVLMLRGSNILHDIYEPNCSPNQNTWCEAFFNAADSGSATCLFDSEVSAANYGFADPDICFINFCESGEFSFVNSGAEEINFLYLSHNIVGATLDEQIYLLIDNLQVVIGDFDDPGEEEDGFTGYPDPQLFVNPQDNCLFDVFANPYCQIILEHEKNGVWEEVEVLTLDPSVDILDCGQSNFISSITSCWPHRIRQICPPCEIDQISNIIAPPCENNDPIIQFVPQNPSVCLDNSGTTTLSTGFDPNNFSFQWSTNETTPDITVDAIGDFSVTVTDLTTNCSSSNTVTVNDASFNLVLSSNVTCWTSGTNQATITFTPSEVGSYSYFITGGDPNGQADNFIIVNGPEEIEVTALDTNTGCSAVSTIFIPSDGGEIDLGTGPLQLCDDGSSLVLNTNIDATTGFTWFENGVVIPGETGNSLTINSVGDYSVEYDDGMCMSLGVISVEEINIPITLSDYILCISEGEETLSIEILDFNSLDFEYTLMWGNQAIPILSNIFIINEAELYTLQVATYSGCMNTAQIDVQENQMNLEFISNIEYLCDPTETFTVDEDNFINPTNIDFANSIFTWNLEGVFYSNNFPLDNISQEGLFSLEVESGLCTSEASFELKHIEFSIDEITLPCLTDGETTSTTISVTSEDELSLTYTVTDDNGISSTSLLNEIEFSDVGEYDITVEDISGCIESTIITVEECLDAKFDCNPDIPLDAFYIDADINPNISFWLDLLNTQLVTFSGFGPAHEVANQSIAIKGDLIIDINVSFNDCDLYFDNNAELRTNAGNLFATNSTRLQACKLQWDGIVIEGNTIGFFDNVENISDSYHAILFRESSVAHVANVEFNNNVNSLSFSGDVQNRGLRSNNFNNCEVNSIRVSSSSDFIYPTNDDGELYEPTDEFDTNIFGYSGHISISNSNINLNFINSNVSSEEHVLINGNSTVYINDSNFENGENGIKFSNNLGTWLNLKNTEVKNFDKSGIQFFLSNNLVHLDLNNTTISGDSGISSNGIKVSGVNGFTFNFKNNTKISGNKRGLWVSGGSSGGLIKGEPSSSSNHFEGNSNQEIIVGGTNIALEGLSILSNNSNTGINIDGGDQISLRDNHIESSSGNGVIVDNNQKVFICNNTLKNGDVGLQLLGSGPESMILKNIFDNNTIGLNIEIASIGETDSELQEELFNKWASGGSHATLGNNLDADENIFIYNPTLDPGSYLYAPENATPDVDQWFIPFPTGSSSEPTESCAITDIFNPGPIPCDSCDDILIITDSDDHDNDGFTNDVDCNDFNPNINPEADDDSINGIDENCDGVDGPTGPGLIDNDEDGYFSDIDCDDTNVDINPSVEEVLDNGIDDNCDGVIDVVVVYTDNDADGFDSSTDCDDTNPNIFPGAVEIIGNDIDENCNGIDDSTSPDDIFDPCWSCTDDNQGSQIEADGDWNEVNLNCSEILANLNNLVNNDLPSSVFPQGHSWMAQERMIRYSITKSLDQICNSINPNYLSNYSTKLEICLSESDSLLQQFMNMVPTERRIIETAAILLELSRNISKADATILGIEKFHQLKLVDSLRLSHLDNNQKNILKVEYQFSKNRIFEIADKQKYIKNKFSNHAIDLLHNLNPSSEIIKLHKEYLLIEANMNLPFRSLSDTELINQNIEAIQRVADSCPYEIGKIVNRARSILDVHVNERRYYNNGVICNREDSEEREGNLHKQFDFAILPNPMESDLTIILHDESITVDKLVIYDIFGNILESLTMPDRYLGKISIPLANVPSGLYYCKLFSDSSTSTKSFVKVK